MEKTPTAAISRSLCDTQNESQEGRKLLKDTSLKRDVAVPLRRIWKKILLFSYFSLIWQFVQFWLQHYCAPQAAQTPPTWFLMKQSRHIIQQLSSDFKSRHSDRRALTQCCFLSLLCNSADELPGAWLAPWHHIMCPSPLLLETWALSHTTDPHWNLIHLTAWCTNNLLCTQGFFLINCHAKLIYCLFVQPEKDSRLSFLSGEFSAHHG